MAGQTGNIFSIECVIFYVDPNSVGSMSFLGRESIRFSLTIEHSSLIVLRKKTQRIRGIKDRSTELKFIRLEKGKEGSEVFSRDWNISRQLDSLTDRNKNSWWIGRQAMDKRCDRGVWGKRQQFLISGNLPLNMYRASDYPKRKVSFSPYAFD